MSLKAELETWSAALLASTNDLPGAIRLFEGIGDTSKIEWNIGILLATLGRHLEAIARFRRATELDGWLVIAWVQCGISRFMLGQYEAAYKDFEAAAVRMRGNEAINYTQLGLAYTLNLSGIIFNRGLARLHFGQVDQGMADLMEAQRSCGDEGQSRLMAEAIRKKGLGVKPISIPNGILFEPAQGKLKNLAARDYMGKAVLIAATSPSDAYTSFTGTTLLERGLSPSGVPLPPSHPLSRSKSASPLRSASISAIPLPGDATPIATRMSRGGRFASVDETKSSITPGYAGVGSTYGGIREDLPIMTPSTPPRKAPTPPQLSKLIIPSEPAPITMELTDLIDNYYSPDSSPDSIPTPAKSTNPLRIRPQHRPREGSITKWEKEGLEKLNNSPGRVVSTLRGSPAQYAPGLGLSLARSGSTASYALSRQGSMAMRFEEENWEMKIRIKVHIAKHTRALSLPSTCSYTDLISSLHSKFPDLGQDHTVLFKDEDGDMVSMVDEGDWEAGVDVARALGGKLEIWVE